MSKNGKIFAILVAITIWMLPAIVIASPVPDTGQTQCYDDQGNVISCPNPGQPFYGQDAQYNGPQHSYTKLGQNGVSLSDSAARSGGWIMTRDNVTGLIWEIKQNRDGVSNYSNPHDADNTYTWYDPTDSNPGIPGNGTDTKDFIDALNSARFGGFIDWRLPTIKELSYLEDSSIPPLGPTINTSFFPDIQSTLWSSTSSVDFMDDAWSCLSSGVTFGGNLKSNSLPVLAVRGGQSGSLNHFIINGDGTVTDTSTGLMWQQDTAPGSYIWQQALAYCENLTLAGHSDWRLPNRNELQSIIDYTQSHPSIATSVFPNTVADGQYWSSTTYVDDSFVGMFALAWTVDFYRGGVGRDYKSIGAYGSSELYVRAVRGGHSEQSADPVILMSPTSGLPGTVFTESGTGFTPNSTATLHFLKPDGNEFPTRSQPIDENGQFEITYTAPLDAQIGTYTWWGVDETAEESNELSYEIHSADSASRLYGLFIGIDFHSLLNDPFGFRGDASANLVRSTFVNSFPNVQAAIPLTGSNISKGQILEALKKINNQMDRPSSDLFFLYIASHGDTRKSGPDGGESTISANDEYVVLDKSFGENPDFYLTDDELYSLLCEADMANKMMWIFIDACHGGGFWGNKKESGGDLEKLPHVKFLATATEDKPSFYSNWPFTFCPISPCWNVSLGAIAFAEGFGKNENNQYYHPEFFDDNEIAFKKIYDYIKENKLITEKEMDIVYEMEFGDPVVFTKDMWNPQFEESDDSNSVISVIGSDKTSEFLIAEAGGPYTGGPNSNILFDASGSYSPNGEIIEYNWDWNNDGVYDESSSSAFIKHSWDSPYDGYIGLQIIDDKSFSGEDIAIIEVKFPEDIDEDGDGYTLAQGDCNDNNATIHPGATEICGDSKDNNCNGSIDEGCSQANPLNGLTISGPASVNENSTVKYTATAAWNDGSTSTVTPTWSEDSTYSSVNASGVLTTSEVASNQMITIIASYTSGGITRSATKSVTIVNVSQPETTVPSPVPDTGQIKCYDDVGNVIPCPSPGHSFYGQDANYTINPPSYTKLDEKGKDLPDSATSWTMIRDNVTGLIWEVKQNEDDVKNYSNPHDADNTYSWYDSNPATNDGDAGTPGDGTDTEDFISALNDSGYGGHHDWRLPTIKELAFALNYDNSMNYDATFLLTHINYYYSSTSFSHDIHHVWISLFGHTFAFPISKNKEDLDPKDTWIYDHIKARAVRGGQPVPSNNWEINGDGTVTDKNTGLMWQQATAPGTYTWKKALSYSENLTFAGYKDWRLPSINELQSLVDYTNFFPAIDFNVFPDTVVSKYWSSTTDVTYPERAKYVDFFDGKSSSYGKDGTDYEADNHPINLIYVRAVRSVQPEGNNDNSDDSGGDDDGGGGGGGGCFIKNLIPLKK